MSAPQRSPVHLWLVALLCALTAVSGCWSNALILTGRAPLTPKMRSYVDSWSVFDKTIPFVAGFLLILASVALVRRHHTAVGLLRASFILTVVMSSVHAISTTWLATMGLAGIIGVAINWLFYGFLWWYAARLQRQGILGSPAVIEAI